MGGRGVGVIFSFLYLLEISPVAEIDVGVGVWMGSIYLVCVKNLSYSNSKELSV